MKKKIKVNLRRESLKGFKKLAKLIKANKRFLVTSHKNVEPDALGSELAFARFLRSKGKKVFIVNNEEIPARFKFMPGASCVRKFKDVKLKALDFEVAIILDSSDLNRIGRVRKLISDQHILINIDHHISNNQFGNLNIVRTDVSSTCELIYGIFKVWNIGVDKQMALNLYSGILTDTGSFRYSNATSTAFAAASELVNFGLDTDQIYRQVYKIGDLNQAKIIGQFLRQAETASRGEIVYLLLPDKLSKQDISVIDLGEQALNILRLISGAKVFFLLRRIGNGNSVRINLRSNCNVDVNKIARIFNGGGHKRAAGATVSGKLNSVKNAVLEEIKKNL